MKQERWLRIIPVALIMYTISYVDRTNVSLALDPSMSMMMKDLLMNDRMKGEAVGVFFFGYLLLQIPGGYLASRWSPKKLVAIFLVLWGAAAVSCGLVKTFREFEFVRFLLGVAESGVFPVTLVLLANWFPKAERARANAYWNLCQPLAVAGSAPLTGWLLGHYGWKTMLVLEGVLPMLWLPIWWFFIYDHPREAPWISPEERQYLETELKAEATQLQILLRVDPAPPTVETELKAEATQPQPVKPIPIWRAMLHPTVLIMLVIYFLHNCAAYGCMFFLTSGLKNPARTFTGLQSGILFAIPYVLTAFVMVANSWHSDKTQERRKHILLVYVMSGSCLIASVFLQQSAFWTSYVFLCFAIPGPFAGMAPFWAIPAETMPRNVMGSVMGLVNAIGNLGGFLGPYVVGWLKLKTAGIIVPFSVLGAGLIVAGFLALALPKTAIKLPGSNSNGVSR